MRLRSMRVTPGKYPIRWGALYTLRTPERGRSPQHHISPAASRTHSGESKAATFEAMDTSTGLANEARVSPRLSPAGQSPQHSSSPDEVSASP